MTTVEAPSRVVRAAADHDLGPFIAGNKGGNPFANALFALVVSALLLGAVVLVGSLGLKLLRRILIVGLALSLLGLFFAVVTLLTGFRRFFLYANGVVRWQNGRVKVIHWRDVTSMTRTRLGNIRTGYAINLADGKKVQIEAIENAEAGKLFGQQVEHVAAQTGVYIGG